MAEAITVSELNQHIKVLLDRDGLLNNVFVRGEISNYKAYPSGHHYFSLKDQGSSIRCVLFRREAASLRFRPENGMKVIVNGRVSVFPRDGQYQLYCVRMVPDGAGDLAVAFEQLKARLAAEGLFDPGHKKPLPQYPNRIALVTSPAGAAVRDMLRILKARWPMAGVVILPVRVQGEEAAGEIAAAIRLANRQKLADLIITGRGGGSMEDLWAFNEEIVARAIFASEIPVISAVGHEPDVTISDFVADLRAATPSNAAELSVPDQAELKHRMQNLETRFSQALLHRLEHQKSRLDRLKSRPVLATPLRMVQERRILLDYQQQRLARGLENRMNAEQTRFRQLAASLDALSPLKVLGRGYAIAQKEDGTVVRSVKSLRNGERFRLRVSDGTIFCITEE